MGEQNCSQTCSQFYRHLSPSLDSQVLAQSGSLLYLHASSGVTAPGGTNSACQWLLAHGGLQSSRRQGCGFTRHPSPCCRQFPRKMCWSVSYFCICARAVARAPGTHARISSLSLLVGQGGLDPEIGSAGQSMLLITPRLWVQSLYGIFA